MHPQTDIHPTHQQPALSEHDAYRRMVLLPAFLAPIIGGAILYYRLRSSQPQIAAFANKMSWLGFALWAAVNVILMKALPQPLSTTLKSWIVFTSFAAGVFLAVRAVRIIRAEK